jgi:hypothetical protein
MWRDLESVPKNLVRPNRVKDRGRKSMGQQTPESLEHFLHLRSLHVPLPFKHDVLVLASPPRTRLPGGTPV